MLAERQQVIQVDEIGESSWQEYRRLVEHVAFGKAAIKALRDLVTDVIQLTDRHGVVRVETPNTAEIYGASTVGHEIADFMPPDLAAQHREGMRRSNEAIEKGHRDVDYFDEEKIYELNGQLVAVLVKVLVQRDEVGGLEIVYLGRTRRCGQGN